MLSVLERKGLFIFTRVFALLLIVALLIGIALIGFQVLSGLPKSVDTTVTPAMVVQSLKSTTSAQNSSEGSVPASADPYQGLTVPTNVQKLFEGYSGASNKAYIAQSLPEGAISERQAYLDSLEQTIVAGEAAGLGAPQAAERYIGMKKARAAAAESIKTERAANLLSGFYKVGVGLALVGLFSLVLVMLAIERNTRLQQA